MFKTPTLAFKVDGGGVVVHLPLKRAARNESTKARPSLTKTLLAMCALSAAVGAGVQWLITTSFRSDATATSTFSNPHSARLVADPPAALRQLGPNAEFIELTADPALVKGAGLERWWMDVQESVKPEG